MTSAENWKDFLLRPPSWLFGGLVALKNLLYEAGFLTVKHLDKPVISVGNLSMGGTGKSPVTAELVQRLIGMGKRVAVLSRGYGRAQPKSSRRVDANGDWTLYGDEPAMIARRFPDALVCVGPSRYAAAQMARDWLPDIYVIDDGFQHRAIHRDLDMVLIDVTQGLPRLFPRAHFREDLKALRRAHVVVLTRWNGRDELADWTAAIKAVNPDLPILKLAFSGHELRRVADDQKLDPECYFSKKVAAYSGIAHPQRFFDSLARMGLEPALTYALGDHESLRPKRAAAFEQACQEAGVSLILTTEKDSVKLEKNNPSAILKAYLTLQVKWGDPNQITRILNRLLFIREHHDQETD